MPEAHLASSRGVSAVQHLLHKQGEFLQAVQKLVAAALVEVQSWQGSGGIPQSEDQEGPTFLFHCHRLQFIDVEVQRPPTPFVVVVQAA